MKRIDLQSDLKSLDRKIGRLVGPSPSSLDQFNRHLLGGDGKKQRGRLLLLFGYLLSVPHKELLTAAGAVETVHLATLIHDDIIDGAGQRRGNKTLHRIHGVRPALLYGDLLFTRGISAVNRLGNQALTDLLLSTVREICSGEILEGEQRGRFPWEEKVYFQIIRRKTASLFQFSCQAPGLLAGISKNRLTVLRRLGLNLGCAYQIADDCLDFAPLSAPFDKDRLADLKNDVPNLPLLIAARTPSLKKELQAAIGNKLSRAKREKLGELIRRSGAVKLAAGRGGRFLDRAGKDLALTRKWEKSPVSAILEKLLAGEQRRLQDLAEY